MYRPEDTSEHDFDQLMTERPGILINGAHHAWELTTISMNVYLMLKLLWSWVKTEDGTNLDPDLLNSEDLLLRSAVLIFIPVVNIDGFTYISDIYSQTGDLKLIRKNRANYLN